MGEVSAVASDRFAEATALIGTNLTVNGDNTVAGSEPGEPQHFPTGSKKSLWWIWTAPESGKINLSNSGANRAYEIAIYQGDSLTALQRLAHTTNELNYQFYLEVKKGMTYFFAADGLRGFSGEIQFNLELHATPLNDLFANRFTLLEGEHTFEVNLGAANREPLEPRLNRGKTSGRTLWWKLTSTKSGMLQVAANAVNASSLVSIGCFQGSQFPRLRRVTENTREIWVPIKAGVEYQIAIDPLGLVDLFHRHAQTIQIYSRFEPAPDNDYFTKSLELAGPSISLTNDNFAASAEIGEPRPVRFPRLRASMWYHWTAPDFGWIYLSADASDFPPILGIYEGTSLRKLRKIQQSSFAVGNNTTVVGFETVPGTTYRILVDGLNHDRMQRRGKFALNLEYTTLRLTSPTNAQSFSAGSPPQLTINVPNGSVDGTLATVDFVLIRQGYGEEFRETTLPPNFVSTPGPISPGHYTAVAVASNTLGRAIPTPPIYLVAHPVNDHFSNATVMHSYQWHDSGSVAAATIERGEAHPGGPANGSVWYSWTAPQSGPVEIQTSLPESLFLNVYSGTDRRRLKRISLKSTNDFAQSFSAVAGTNYHFAVLHKKRAVDNPGTEFEINVAMRSLRLTSPTANAIFTDRDIVPLRIDDGQGGTNITQVEYLLNGSVVASNAVAPFGVDVSELRPGDYVVTARALLLSGEIAETAPLTVQISLANNHFTNAIVLNGTQVVEKATLYGATMETGEPVHSFKWPQRTAWWIWTAPETGRVWIDFHVTNAMPFVFVRIGESIGSLSGAPTITRTNVSHLELQAVAGTTYRILLVDDAPCEGTLALRYLRAPTNDSFANRTVLTGTNIQFEGTLIMATQESGEPVSQDGCGYTGRSIWYSWTAPADGWAVVRSLIANGECLRINVFSGDILTNLFPVGSGSGGNTTPAVFEVKEGVTYQIVMNNSNEVDPISTTLQFNATASNNDFENLITVTGASFDVTCDLLGSDLEPGEPAHLDWWFGTRSVWYEWTAPASGEVLVTQLSNFPTPVVDVFTGTNLATLQTVGIGWNPQKFYAESGVTYQLALGGYGNLFGPASAHIELQPESASVGAGVGPRITIQQGNDGLKITWPAVVDGVLEMTSDPGDSLNWQPINAEKTIEGDHYAVTLDTAPGAVFFRLRIEQ